MFEESLYMVTSMLENMADDPKFMPTLARTYRKLYDELLNVGFTSEEAIKIVAHMKTGQ